ncbi:MAG TPA: tetratricopeptide repeat protein [Gammaproteobacteria bacterium]
MNPFRRSRTAVPFLICLVWAGAAAPDPARVSALMEDGKLEEALAVADQDLAGDPGNVTVRFLKGLVLTRMNRLDDAAAAFEGLTEDHPELPEPYNNLAVVYAAKGDFERARQALQKAINTHPSYATAHENMGDIYAKMASQAYNQALELNEDNPTAKAKLSLINNLFSLPSAPAPTQVAAATPPKSEAAPAPPATQPEARPAEPPPVPETRPAPVSPTPEPQAQAGAGTEPATAEPARVQPPAGADEVRRTVDLWATAWSAKDFPAYVRLYAADFVSQDDESRAAWEKSRRQRIMRPAFIKVDVSGLQISMLGADRAQAVFTQNYQSDTFSDSVKKTLVLRKSGDQWLITQETTE